MFFREMSIEKSKSKEIEHKSSSKMDIALITLVNMVKFGSFKKLAFIYLKVN